MAETALTESQRATRPKWTEFIPITPTIQQREFLLLEQLGVLEAFLGGAGGGGKMLPLDTQIPTPGGWMLNGDLVAGDCVFGSDGNPLRVLMAHPIQTPRKAFRLVFDDGAEQVAGGDHLWLTFDSKERGDLVRRSDLFRAKRRSRRPSRVGVIRPGSWSASSGNKSALFTASLIARNKARTYTLKSPPTGTVRTTIEIAETLLNRRGEVNHAIPVAAPLDLPDVPLPIDPYLLGVWLGDGTSGAAQITTADREIVSAFRRGGYKVTKHSGKYSWGILGLYRQLRENRLMGNKHVPAAYLRASCSQRLALLQGLMDTDGTVARESGCSEFDNTSRVLIDSVHELIVSLGWKARITESRAMLYGKDCGPTYSIKWTPSEFVFRLPRKRKLQRLAAGRTTGFRYIVACYPVEPIPMRCITVDSSSGMYLAGRSMIPTHNSVGLLAGGLQYVDVPRYSALIVRSSFAELSLPGALLDVAREWLRPYLASGKVKYSAELHRYTFPSSATLSFGFLGCDGDEDRYSGSAFDYIGVDESTHLPERRVRFLFSRLRRSAGSRIPPRFRLASNPGGISHSAHKVRYVDPKTRAAGVHFIPARLEDNPYIDAEAYRASLSRLDPVTRARILMGDWDAEYGGGVFKPDAAKIIQELPRGISAWCRGWDFGASSNDTSDWTVGALLCRTHEGEIVVAHVARFRKSPGARDREIERVARQDPQGTLQVLEEEPGSGGKAQVETLRRGLAGLWTDSDRPTGGKLARAGPFASAWDTGRVSVLAGPWVGDYLDELQAFPDGEHDDQVDASALAYSRVGVVGSRGPLGSGGDAPARDSAAGIFSGLKPN